MEDDYDEGCDHDHEDGGPCVHCGAPNEFAQPGSALRAATPDNPRNLPCPNCEQPNKLTPKDVALHYQCDDCADAQEC